METRIALIGIILETRESVDELNHLLSEYGDYVIGRMGIPYREKGIHVISVAMDAPNNIISVFFFFFFLFFYFFFFFFVVFFLFFCTSGHTDSGLPAISAVSESEGISLIDKLEQTRALTRTEWAALIHGRTPVISEYLFARARKARIRYYGKDIYIRGLIEFTNYCRNDCYYCGIRKSNKNAVRYRLTKDQILSCCENGYRLGFRTFVLQGGEDGWFTEDRMTDIVSGIRQRFPDCAITLSIGELPRESYRRSLRPEQTDTFSATRLTTLLIIPGSIQLL